MSVTVRPDYFQGTCFFDFYSEFESFLGLICDLLPIGDSWSLLGRSLFCGELFTDSFRSIRGKLYGGLRRDNFWYKVLLQIPGSYWSQLESVNRLPLLELLSDQGLNITRFDIALDDYRLIIGAKRYNYKSDDGQSQKGVKFFAIDPLSYDESDDYFGFQLLEASLSGSTLEPFSQVPAYYYVEMEQTRGRNGDAVYKPTLVEFKTNFTLSAAPPPPSN